MQMWATFVLIGATVALFAGQWIALELVALGIIAALMLLFYFFPLPGPEGLPVLTPEELLSGFANPALITILGLLVIGQALHQTGAMEDLVDRLAPQGRARARRTVLLLLLAAALFSAFMNNTPVVVIFLPVLAALANRFGPGAGKVLMPLSFITILGGNLTIIGSSTNLLVADAARREIGYEMSFFELTIPGGIIAVFGILYTLLAVPRLLAPAGAPASGQEADGRQYIAQIELAPGHPLEGTRSVGGLFPTLRGVTVLKVERGEKSILPPFEAMELWAGDTLIVAATRAALTAVLKIHQEPISAEAQLAAAANGKVSATRQMALFVMAEAAVAPGSRLEGRFLEQSTFKAQTGCTVIGLQRRRQMPRTRLDGIRLEAGDVLLILGPQYRVLELRSDRDLLVLEGSVTRVPHFAAARPALVIFALTVAAAATGLVPIVIAAVCGAGAAILTGCLTVRQATRALDRQIIMLVAASIAMAMALDRTGGAQFLAGQLIQALSGSGNTVILSAIFLLVAVLTNLLSNNATALLFTPIAISTAAEAGANPMAFIHAVIFAASCSFATPIGYQTNLLVLGPGNYRFVDFLRAGTPLLIIVWVIFTMLIPWYYGL